MFEPAHLGYCEQMIQFIVRIRRKNFGREQSKNRGAVQIAFAHGDVARGLVQHETTRGDCGLHELLIKLNVIVCERDPMRVLRDDDAVDAHAPGMHRALRLKTGAHAELRERTVEHDTLVCCVGRFEERLVAH